MSWPAFEGATISVYRYQMPCLHYQHILTAWEQYASVKIGTGIGTIPAGFLTDSIAVRRWPVRGSAWADRKDAESWVGQ